MQKLQEKGIQTSCSPSSPTWLLHPAVWESAMSMDGPPGPLVNTQVWLHRHVVCKCWLYTRHCTRFPYKLFALYKNKQWNPQQILTISSLFVMCGCASTYIPSIQLVRGKPLWIGSLLLLWVPSTGYGSSCLDGTPFSISWAILPAPILTLRKKKSYIVFTRHWK